VASGALSPRRLRLSSALSPWCAMKRSEYYRLAAQGEPDPVKPAAGPSPDRWVKIGLSIFLGLVVIVIAGFLALQLLARQVANAPTTTCLWHLREIRSAALFWAAEHHTNQLPTDFALFAAQLGDPKLLKCPWDFGQAAASTSSELSPSNTSYVIMARGAVRDSTNEYVVCSYHHYAIMGNGELSHDQKGRVRRASP
jgi:hypothetical protein